MLSLVICHEIDNDLITIRKNTPIRFCNPMRVLPYYAFVRVSMHAIKSSCDNSCIFSTPYFLTSLCTSESCKSPKSNKRFTLSMHACRFDSSTLHGIAGFDVFVALGFTVSVAPSSSEVASPNASNNESPSSK